MEKASCGKRVLGDSLHAADVPGGNVVTTCFCFFSFLFFWGGGGGGGGRARLDLGREFSSYGHFDHAAKKGGCEHS